MERLLAKKTQKAIRGIFMWWFYLGQILHRIDQFISNSQCANSMKMCTKRHPHPKLKSLENFLIFFFSQHVATDWFQIDDETLIILQFCGKKKNYSSSL